MSTVACRGSWMPGANEVLGCGLDKSLKKFPEENLNFPTNFVNLKKTFDSSSKISDDLFFYSL